MKSKTSQYHHGHLAESLIDAALPLLASKGPAQLSLREVARIAGVSHGAPAHHFGDKTGLLTQVAVLGHERLTEWLLASRETIETPYERLLEAGKTYVHFAVNNRGYFSVMFQSELIHAESPAYLTAQQASRQVLLDRVREVAGDKFISNDDIDATLTALWSQVHGFSVLWLSGNFGDTSDMHRLEFQLSGMLNAIEPRL